MNNENYVAPEGSGFVVVIGGRVVGIYRSEDFEGDVNQAKQAAEDAYNQYYQPAEQVSTNYNAPQPVQTQNQPTVVREYNEPTPEGGYRFVQQMSDGTYRKQLIATTDYQAAGITAPYVPSPSNVGKLQTGDNIVAGGSEYLNLAGQVANNAAQQAYLRQRLTELELPASQHTIDMDLKRYALDVGMRTYDDIMNYGKTIGYVPKNMPTARELAGISGTNSTSGTSLDSARQSLYKASGNMDYWLTAPNEQVISEYKKQSGQDVGTTVVTTGNTTGQGMAGYYGNLNNLGELVPTVDRTNFEASSKSLNETYPALSAFPKGYTSTPQAIPTLEAEVSDLKNRLGLLQAAGSGFSSFNPPIYK